MTLAARLQKMLADRGFSISEAARAAGMEKQQCWRIITGQNSNPGIQTVERIVAAVGGTLGELFADED